MMKTTLQKIYMGLIFLFLYAPIATLMVLSFNASKTRAKWGGFTLKWYQALFRNSDILNALRNTLLIALVASIAATIIGTAACISIMSLKKKSRTIIIGITNIPMLNAEIVTGISLMLLFLSLGLRFGLGTILLSHITFCIPYVILSVMPRMQHLSPYTYEAALDLGANPFKAMVKVILPILAPSIMSGFMMAFTLSMDDFIITQINKGAATGINTLSTYIYADARVQGLSPFWFAIFSIIFIVVLTTILVVNVVKVKKAKADKKKEVKA